MKNKPPVIKCLLPLLAIAMFFHPAFGASKTVIKLGSLAPEGTPFYDVIYQISNAWKTASNRKVLLKIYAGGVAGSETDMVRKMKIGQLQGASMSALGISLIDPGYAALQLPALISTETELALYRRHMLPIIEERLAEKDYIAMAHCDMGPLHFFTSKKVTSVEELMKLKVCTFSSNRASKEVWTNAGFTVIDLSSSEVLAGLQTGMIEGFIHSPLYALSMQWFAKAKYMIKVNYGFVLAATVIKKKSWKKISPELRKTLKEIAFQETEKIMIEIKKLNEGAIPAMVKHGLIIVEPSKEDIPRWLGTLSKAYPATRGALIPVNVYDKLMSVKDTPIQNSHK
jgi:TRAP-type C4-dicarboxylate transport system substrate-binding protein